MTYPKVLKGERERASFRKIKNYTFLNVDDYESFKEVVSLLSQTTSSKEALFCRNLLETSFSGESVDFKVVKNDVVTLQAFIKDNPSRADVDDFASFVLLLTQVQHLNILYYKIKFSNFSTMPKVLKISKPLHTEKYETIIDGLKFEKTF